MKKIVVALFLMFGAVLFWTSGVEHGKNQCEKEQAAPQTISTSTHIEPTVAAQPVETIPQPEPKSMPEKVESKWSYSEDEDDIGRGTIYFAEIESENTVNFGFPYNGEQHAKLIIRKQPKDGLNVLLMLDKAQFHCSFGDTCRINVKFAGKPVESFQMIESASSMTNVLFFRYAKNFVDQIQKSDETRIEASFYQEPLHTFIFDTRGLEWKH